MNRAILPFDSIESFVTGTLALGGARSLREALAQKLGSVMRRLGVTHKRESASRPSSGREPSPPARALRWMADREAQSSGDRHPIRADDSRLSLTGDSVETLLQYGAPETADRVVRRLIASQRPDGSITDSRDGWPSEFQTARALEGLLEAKGRVPEALDAAARAFRYLCSPLSLRSRLSEQSKSSSDKTYSVVPPVCLLPPVARAAPLFGEAKWRSLEDPLRIAPEKGNPRPPMTGLNRRVACELHALIRLGRESAAEARLEELQALQRPDGAIVWSRKPSVVQASALAQIAICWYKTGLSEAADKALEWLESKQTDGGGFFGSYGRGTEYLPTIEHPAAAKLYLDANRLRVISFMDRHEAEIRSYIEPEDERLQSILKLVRRGDSVIEVGCGKGRYLRAIREVYPDVKCSGVDISLRLLQEVPEGIEAIEGSLESVPCADESFDVVFSVEAIEHSANPGASVAELTRIARPGGWIAIIDKQQSQWGRLECPPWERWPQAEALKNLLERGCEEVQVEATGYDQHPADGLMVIWRGRKVRDARAPNGNPV